MAAASCPAAATEVWNAAASATRSGPSIKAAERTRKTAAESRVISRPDEIRDGVTQGSGSGKSSGKLTELLQDAELVRYGPDHRAPFRFDAIRRMMAGGSLAERREAHQSTGHVEALRRSIRLCGTSD